MQVAVGRCKAVPKSIDGTIKELNEEKNVRQSQRKKNKIYFGEEEDEVHILK